MEVHLLVSLQRYHSYYLYLTEENKTVVKDKDPIYLKNSPSIVKNHLRNLIETVNDKMNNIETPFSLIRTMAGKQTLLKSENAELKVLMTEVKYSLENHHTQCQTRNKTMAKIQYTMSQKDKENGDLMRTVTELPAHTTKLTTGRVLSSLGLVLCRILTRIKC